MNRLLGLLAALGTTAVLFVGCTAPPPPSDDDDNNNNASCGSQCLPTQQCLNGRCVCSQGLWECGTVCTNLASDRANCGQCGVVCPPSAQYCSNGACSATCNGLACPNGACVNPANDGLNCGVCGNICPGGSTCQNGVCACPAGTDPCIDRCVPAGTCNGGGGTGGNVGTGGASGIGGGGTFGTGGATGGATTGGVSGSTTGGASGAGPTGGTGGVISGNPPGWWTHGSWHGCTWTGVDTLMGTTTRNMPQDFRARMDGTAYCMQGQVHWDYDAVSLMGFNLNETPNGSATQCAYNPAAAMQMGPPGVTLSGSGFAINFSKSTAATLRIQIQGPNGATDPMNRWCATITEAAGPVFVPYSAFNTECWEGGMGMPFNPASSPISAVSFLTPGVENTTMMPLAFNYCISGFATGGPTDPPPDWGTGVVGPVTGTIGGPGGMNIDFQRVKVSKGGESYIIQNNNWGNWAGSDQLLRYSDNSFVVESSTGSGSQAPASFPSIFIGANGDVQAGTYSTRTTDSLPKQISAIQSVQSTFRHTGTSGQINAAYDIWFSDHAPTGARYDDAISGFIMLWLYDPNGMGPPQPIGSVLRSNVMVGGRPWNVWVGPRGATGAICEGVQCSASRPVVSYVATSTQTTFSGDLKPFFTDAAQHGIGASWYLTDVFAGFECWSGADCTGKAVQEFTAVVAP